MTLIIAGFQTDAGYQQRVWQLSMCACTITLLIATLDAYSALSRNSGCTRCHRHKIGIDWLPCNRLVFMFVPIFYSKSLITGFQKLLFICSLRQHSLSHTCLCLDLSPGQSCDQYIRHKLQLENELWNTAWPRFNTRSTGLWGNNTSMSFWGNVVFFEMSPALWKLTISLPSTIKGTPHSMKLCT